MAALARAAGAVVMEVYRGGFVASHKDDASPVTEADLRAEALIVPRLATLLPGVPVVAEEAMATGRGPAFDAAAAERFWLVDPLDGTREFVRRNGEFTVNIALVERGVPVLGVVLAPALQPAARLFAGLVGVGAWVEEAVAEGPAADSPGHGGVNAAAPAAAGAARAADAATPARRPIRVRARPAGGLTLSASRSHGSHDELRAWLARAGIGVAAERRIGSSLKFGVLAAGEADCYPRLSRTMEWDTAAGHAVLAAAGGQVLTLEGAPLRYGKPGFENPGFVAWGGS